MKIAFKLASTTEKEKNSKYDENLKSMIDFVMACFLSNHGTHACIINLLSSTGNAAAELCLRAQPIPGDFVPLNTAGTYGEIKDNPAYLL